jgi:hypothetical protein
MESKEQYLVKISDRFMALETQTMTWISTGLGKLLERIQNFQLNNVIYYEVKQHKSSFDEGCPEISDQRT